MIVGYDQWPLPNVWLGVSVEDQLTANQRILQLVETPAAVRWISAEPLLGPVDLSSLPYPTKVKGNIHWVVVGGESGKNARPMHPQWARSLRNQCQFAGIPFLFKQWGEFAPSPDGGLPDDLPESAGYYFEDPHPPGKTWRFGKKRAGRMLDGEVWDQYPELAQ